MGRPRKTDKDVRAVNASLRTMLSAARLERDSATDALDAVITVIGGCRCGKDKEARQAARKALDRERAAAGQAKGEDQ